MSETLNIKPENNQVLKCKSIVQQYLSKEEVHQLLQKSDIKGVWEIFRVWIWVVVAFVLVGLWPNVATVIIALILIGAMQLGCAIIMHDASHYSLFNSRRMNDLVGNWFGGYPMIHNVRQYRPYHLQHHLATGSEDDPDINLAKGYPTTKVSMVRKFSRDLTGVTGIKGYIGVIAMHLGILKYNLGNMVDRVLKEERGYMLGNAWHNLRGPLAFHILLFGICWAFGKPFLYFLWPAAMLTTYMFVIRVRSMAEHSMVSDVRDPLQNTRTLSANFLERLLFAPLNVNYHLEHHLLFTVPCYNLKAMHKLLKERGLYKTANYSKGYWNIIKMAVKGQSSR